MIIIKPIDIVTNVKGTGTLTTTVAVTSNVQNATSPGILTKTAILLFPATSAAKWDTI